MLNIGQADNRSTPSSDNLQNSKTNMTKNRDKIVNRDIIFFPYRPPLVVMVEFRWMYFIDAFIRQRLKPFSRLLVYVFSLVGMNDAFI